MQNIIVLALISSVGAVSPVQKVIELLDDCKGKVAKDLAAEAAVMEEYTTFCDDESKEKGYAIETSTREIGELGAAIEDAKATILEKTDEMSTLASVLGAKDKELAYATAVRSAKNEEFVA